MIKGLILAGMCAMGSQGITQKNIGEVGGEIEIVSELSQCTCNGQNVIDCDPRFKGKDGKIYVRNKDRKYILDETQGI